MVIITGAARGLGLAYARRLAEEGASVMLADRDEETPEAREITSSSPKARFVTADIRSPEDARKLADQTLSHFGRIDVLINNAALITDLERRPFEELSAEDWKDVLDVNVIGTFLCTQAVVPSMKESGAGKIINVGSNVVHKGLPQLLHYVASKGAVHALTRALARELGPFGITVNAIAPGYVHHEGTAQNDGGRNEQVISLRALGRAETPDDLLGTIVFLASDDSEIITGQTIVVDGGEVFA